MTRILNTTKGERGKYLSSPVHLMTGSQRLPSTLASMRMTPWFLSLYHRIIEFGRDLRKSFFQPPAQSVVTYQTGLLRALSSWILKTSKDGDRLSVKPLPLPDCPRGKAFSLYPDWTFLLENDIHCLLSYHCAPLWKAWLRIFNDLSVVIGRWCCLTCSCLCSWLNQPCSLSPSSQGKYFSLPTVSVALLWTISGLLMLLLYWGPHSWMQCSHVV